MQKIIRSPYFGLLVTICIFLLNQLPFLQDMRPVMYDEAWYGNTGYNFSQGRGFLNSAVGSGGNENFILPVLSAGFMKIFGYHLLSIRLTAVFCGIITIIFLFLSARQMRVVASTQALVGFFFISLPLYNTIFRFGRPECAALMCMAGGIWFYLRYRESHALPDIIGLSIFVFLAACAHPFSLLPFALIGVDIGIQALRNKSWRTILHLAFLLAAAIFALGAITYVSSTYCQGGFGVIEKRFSVNHLTKAVPVYFKDAFLSKSVLFILPLLLIDFYVALKDKRYRSLAIISIIHFIIFPFLFSTDIEMVSLGLDYFVYLSTILLCVYFNQFFVKKIIRIPVYLYCFCSLCLSYYYNYGVKYEKANSLLSEELQAIVPEGAKVFGALRQWPFLMNTDYQSDHSRLPLKDIEEYDYIIVNSQDLQIYESYTTLLSNSDTLIPIYKRETRQYGDIIIYQIPPLQDKTLLSN